jgi:hypothetical protein
MIDITIPYDDGYRYEVDSLVIIPGSSPGKPAELRIWRYKEGPTYEPFEHFVLASWEEPPEHLRIHWFRYPLEK